MKKVFLTVVAAVAMSVLSFAQTSEQQSGEKKEAPAGKQATPVTKERKTEIHRQDSIKMVQQKAKDQSENKTEKNVEKQEPAKAGQPK